MSGHYNKRHFYIGLIIIIICSCTTFQKIVSRRRSSHTLLEKLHSAATAGASAVVQELLEDGQSRLDVNRPGSDGRVALHRAVGAQHVETATVLLTYGADVNASSYVSRYRDCSGAQLRSVEEYPLLVAARVGNLPLVALLLKKGANPNAQVQCHLDEAVKTLPDRTALHFAALKADAQMAETLLQFGANITIKDKQGDTPLHLVARCKSCAKQLNVLRLFCQMQQQVELSVNITNKLDCSALYLAAFYGCMSKVESLLATGADVNQCSQQESTYGSALHVAAVKDRVKLAEMLIAHGAILSLPNGIGCTPLMTNINSLSRSTIASLLITHGAAVNETDKHSFTLLGACIKNMRLDCESLCQMLVYAGCDLNRETWLWRVGSCSDGDDTEDQYPSIEIPQGRVERLCEWLRTMRQNPRKLSDQARTAIRKVLSRNVKGTSIERSAQTLPLPRAMKDFLLLKDVMNFAHAE